MVSLSDGGVQRSLCSTQCDTWHCWLQSRRTRRISNALWYRNAPAYIVPSDNDRKQPGMVRTVHRMHTCACGADDEDDLEARAES